jgi:hypothetical protein
MTSGSVDRLIGDWVIGLPGGALTAVVVVLAIIGASPSCWTSLRSSSFRADRGAAIVRSGRRRPLGRRARIAYLADRLSVARRPLAMR